MNMSTSRREFLDYAKAIGIILVVWGHSGIGLNRYISSFHMPLLNRLDRRENNGSR